MTLPIDLYVDTADIEQIHLFSERSDIAGFTTNPTLMRRAGVTNYRTWANEVLNAIGNRDVSFEVLADDETEMERQLRVIAAWKDNVWVKVPVINTQGKSNVALIHRLAEEGVRINVTAITTSTQVDGVFRKVPVNAKLILSIFAGRIADTGRDPEALIRYARARRNSNQCRILWASTREVYNIMQACDCHCDIITVTPELLTKIDMLHRDLTLVSLDTVKQFYDDATNAGYTL